MDEVKIPSNNGNNILSMFSSNNNQRLHRIISIFFVKSWLNSPVKMVLKSIFWLSILMKRMNFCWKLWTKQASRFKIILLNYEFPHSGIRIDTKVKKKWIDASQFKSKPHPILLWFLLKTLTSNNELLQSLSWNALMQDSSFKIYVVLLLFCQSYFTVELMLLSSSRNPSGSNWPTGTDRHGMLWSQYHHLLSKEHREDAHGRALLS